MLPMKIASQCREQRERVYHGAVFEITKDIPDKNIAIGFGVVLQCCMAFGFCSSISAVCRTRDQIGGSL